MITADEKRFARGSAITDELTYRFEYVNGPLEIWGQTDIGRRFQELTKAMGLRGQAETSDRCAREGDGGFKIIRQTGRWFFYAGDTLWVTVTASNYQPIGSVDGDQPMAHG